MKILSSLCIVVSILLIPLTAYPAEVCVNSVLHTIPFKVTAINIPAVVIIWWGGGWSSSSVWDSTTNPILLSSNISKNNSIVSAFVNIAPATFLWLYEMGDANQLSFNSATEPVQIFSSQAPLIPSWTDSQDHPIFTLETQVTTTICSNLVQMYTEEEIATMDIEQGDADAIKAIIMFRGIEKDGSWSEQAFQSYKNSGIAINDEYFEPLRNVTRAEYIKMLVRSLSCRYTYMGNESWFQDVEKDAWHAEYITFAIKNNWIQWYEDGTFRPDNFITRAESAKILANAINLVINDTIFSDFSDINEKNVFINYINAIKNVGIMNGIDNNFMPDEYISRKDVARIFYRTFLNGK